MCNHILNFLVTADNTNEGSVLHWDIALQQLINAVFLQWNYQKFSCPDRTIWWYNWLDLMEMHVFPTFWYIVMHLISYYLHVYINSNNTIKWSFLQKCIYIPELWKHWVTLETRENRSYLLKKLKFQQKSNTIWDINISIITFYLYWFKLQFIFKILTNVSGFQSYPMLLKVFHFTIKWTL